MVSPGFTRWALIIVIVALIMVSIAAATVVMASAVLQPRVVPVIKVEPGVVGPGDIVLVSGKGFPNLANLVLVVALSPTRNLVTEGLLPVGAATVGLDGTVAATFVFPDDVPWTAMHEAWVVVRPATGNLQAAAHLWVHQSRPTPTPTICPASTPLAGRLQMQGTIVQLAAQQFVLTLRLFDGTGDRAVIFRAASIAFLDGRSATLADLKVGISVAAAGWPDSAGTLLAEKIVILESAVAVASVFGPTPVPVCTPVPVAVVVATVCPQPQPVVVVPICTPTRVVCPATLCPRPAPTCVPALGCGSALCPTLSPGCVPPNHFAGEFFANTTFSGAPAAVREFEVIDLDWYQDPPVNGLSRDGYSVRWKGTWDFSRSCRYRFLLLLRGEARLTVDGRTLLELGGNQPAAEYPAEADLAQGPHTVEVDFVRTSQPARVQLRWEPASAVPS